MVNGKKVDVMMMSYRRTVSGTSTPLRNLFGTSPKQNEKAQTSPEQEGIEWKTTLQFRCNFVRTTRARAVHVYRHQGVANKREANRNKFKMLWLAFSQFHVAPTVGSYCSSILRRLYLRCISAEVARLGSHPAVEYRKHFFSVHRKYSSGK
eukprot:scaffold86288_cov39-Attheya_sp.AAC.5